MENQIKVGSQVQLIGDSGHTMVVMDLPVKGEKASAVYAKCGWFLNGRVETFIFNVDCLYLVS